MANELRLADLVVPPGHVVRHAIEIIELADGSKVSLPLLLINGVADGPRLYLGAAIHGDEVSGIEILFQACAQVRPDNLAGSIVCVLVQNPLAFQAEHRLPVGLYLKSPLDQTPIDPWASFPGNAHGNFAERLASVLFSLMTTCDYAIDVHIRGAVATYPSPFCPMPVSVRPSPCRKRWRWRLAAATSCRRKRAFTSRTAFSASKQSRRACLPLP